MPSKMKRRAFRMFLDDFNEGIQVMSDEEAGQLFKEISFYYTEQRESGKEKTAIWKIVKDHIDRQIEYSDTQSENRKGHKGERKDTKGNEVEQRGSPNPNPSPIPLSLNTNTGNVRFKKPTKDQVEEYAKSISFNLNGSNFINYNDSKGWMVGTSKMKDWKAAVRTWRDRRTDASTSTISKPIVKAEILSRCCICGQEKMTINNKCEACRD